MGNQKDRQFHLPKNIRQMGKLGGTCQIYVEDFVYTYVHRTLHEEVKENEISAAVLLGKTYRRGNQEYIFISGAQQVDFSFTGESTVYAEQFSPEEDIERTSDELTSKVDTTIVPDIDIVEQPSASVASQDRQQLFWERVYQGIKEYFSDYELLGWYFSLEGSNLEVTTSMQQFFDATQEHGSRFLYYEDKLNRMDAFFVQAQGYLQRLDGYAVYYEKNPAMQEFLVAQNRHTEPLRTETERQEREASDVAQNYRAILNKLNERPARKKHQPFVYVAGVAVLAVVAATGISQIGNYQNLKVLEHTLQTVSGNVQNADSKNAQDKQTEDSKNVDDQATNAQEEKQNAQEQKQNAQEQKQNAQGSEKQNSEDEQAAKDQNVDAQDENTQNQTTGQATSQAADNQSAQNTEQTAQNQSNKNNNQNAQSSARYYTVKKGDSLRSISKAVYHTTQKVQDICNANQIENMDMIYEGQQLLLP
ncbi:LysM peptidoglycan-binding domain-containing protein [uncultured Eubacterium sp.]|uniref:LysM peptidoglycan-binding domain-containing protein n=1 Tax=uncultured Eubacterium sp. TaxID=165185 RepID=UPI0025E8A317|nr:LysM peptidoglycan-binding domain-containing protein [uncultured Eubacterium sp.]